MNAYTYYSARRQRGATLFIALIMLLIISLLAVSSVREVSLEARITGNLLEQKRLFSASESGLREAEKRFASTYSPPEQCTEGATVATPCVIGLVTDYDTDFSNSFLYSGSGGNTTLARNTRWYARSIPINVNPEYNNTPIGKTYFYEINSQAYNPEDGTAATDCTIAVVCLRSVIARVYN